jgi:mutator protein MutT
MRPTDLFRFCPRCGAPRPADNQGKTPLVCAACGLCFHFNPAVAAAGIIFDSHGKILLVKRARDPSAGKLGVPGGFIDIGESAEEGLRREVREEVGIELEQLQFLLSFPNTYFYREVEYPVVDLYFTAKAVKPESATALDAVAGVEWRLPGDIRDDEYAFPSMRVAVRSLAK